MARENATTLRGRLAVTQALWDRQRPTTKSVGFVRASHVDETKNATMQSPLKNKSRAHCGVLPQLRTLEVSVDAPGKVKSGTIETDLPLANQADFQHGRGERPAAARPSPFSCKSRKEKSGLTRVFVLSKDGTPLTPGHAARARELLTKYKAVVVRRYPFVIRLKHDPHEPNKQPLAIKIEPCAKTTGIAMVRVTSTAYHVLHLSELTHRGAEIKDSLAQRRSF